MLQPPMIPSAQDPQTRFLNAAVVLRFDVCARLLSVLFVTLALLDLPARSAEAPPPEQTASDTVINAAALKPMPQGAIAVKPWDNSDANMALAREIEARLTAKGYTVDPAAPLVLSFETEADAPTGPEDPRRRPVELQGHTSSSNDDNTRVMLNLYSTEKGGVFNDREGANAQPTAPQHHLKMTLDGPIVAANGSTSRGRLWQGEASGRLNRGDDQTLYRSMIGPLVDALGQTVRSAPFGVK